MTYSVQFYPYSEVISKSGSRTEKLMWKITEFIPSMANMIKGLVAIRVGVVNLCDPGIETHGLYVLKKNRVIVSIAEILLNKLNRIITIPEFRKKGYATKLITHIANQMTNNNVGHIYCPVEPSIEPWFEKMGWVKVGPTAPDGTHDFTPSRCIPNYSLVSTYNYRMWINYILTPRLIR